MIFQADWIRVFAVSWALLLLIVCCSPPMIESDQVWAQRLAEIYARKGDDWTILLARNDPDGIRHVLDTFPADEGPIDSVTATLFALNYRPIWRDGRVLRTEWDRRVDRAKTIPRDHVLAWQAVLAIAGDAQVDKYAYGLSPWELGILVDCSSLFPNDQYDPWRGRLLLRRMSALPESAALRIAETLQLRPAWARALIVEHDILFDDEHLDPKRFDSAAAAVAAAVSRMNQVESPAPSPSQARSAAGQSSDAPNPDAKKGKLTAIAPKQSPTPPLVNPQRDHPTNSVMDPPGIASHPPAAPGAESPGEPGLPLAPPVARQGVDPNDAGASDNTAQSGERGTPTEPKAQPEPDSGPGEPIVAPAPTYPRRALEAGKEGVVLLEITIEQDGSVSDVHVVSASPIGYFFEKAAIDAVMARRYRPQPHVRYRVAVEIEFHLK